MSSHFDASEFIDDDLHPARKPGYGSSPLPISPLAGGGGSGTGAAGVGAGGAADARRAPSREEVESKVSEMQHRLAELRNEQQRLERERAALEETRRRQSEFTAGRHEVLQNLTRGIALLEEGEISHRREAEQRARALADMKECLSKVAAINQEAWNKDNFEVELTRGLTAIDNGRMEWNSARVKFSELNVDAASPATDAESDRAGGPVAGAIPHRFADLCRLGFALNWPLFVLGLMIFLMLWLRR